MHIYTRFLLSRRMRSSGQMPCPDALGGASIKLYFKSGLCTASFTMEQTKRNRPFERAYPVPQGCNLGDEYSLPQTGLSKMEYFSAVCLQGILARESRRTDLNIDEALSHAWALCKALDDRAPSRKPDTA